MYVKWYDPWYPFIIAVIVIVGVWIVWTERRKARK